ncbi:MAG: hypothetical protein A2231_10495 [Candidatus Firestonebacteria bacterium RIFOXYA2_FULL_40_8]|nr:MAG: hypothetical protein A2231_10495 [Candidatus Firestonebacteria bacterium RIFOXYA2_FULL_40_8]
MNFDLRYSPEAINDLLTLRNSPDLSKRYKAVVKALGYLKSNPRHPGLNTHQCISLKGPNNDKIFEAYAENNTPRAYRILFYYGPEAKEITIFTIVPHPD